MYVLIILLIHNNNNNNNNNNDTSSHAHVHLCAHTTKCVRVSGIQRVGRHGRLEQKLLLSWYYSHRESTNRAQYVFIRFVSCM